MRPNPILTFSTADLTLAARLEAAEAANGMAMAESIRDLVPESRYERFSGGVAVFAGPGSPMTHALGIGMRGTVPVDELERMEDFFRRCGSDCSIDLCPLADASVLAFVQSRPYRVIEFNNVLVRHISRDENFPQAEHARPIFANELPAWGRTIGASFAEPVPVTEGMANLLSTTCSSAQCWFVHDGLETVGGAAMAVREEVALFVGDAVATTSRRKGLHAQLITARLAAAQRQGIQLAMVSVLPGSASHRNFERLGFQLIYTRANVVREFVPTESN